MAAEKILQGLSEDFLKCSICMNRFQNPLMLPCLHSFCSSCLEKWKATATRKQPLCCPMCRRSVNLPDSGVKGLPSNFLLINLMERLDLVGKLTADKPSDCDFCRNRRSAYFCTDCQLHVCVTCHVGHSRIPGASQHVMIAADKVSDISYLTDVTSKKPPSCTHHPPEKLRFYCTTCSKLVCRDCTVLSHQGHKCCEAERMVGSITTSLKSHLKKSESLVKNTQQHSEKVKAFKAAVETQTTELKRQVDNQFNKYERMLKDQKKVLYQELQKVTNEKNKQFNETLSLSTSWLEATKNTQKLTKQILEGNNQWEVLGIATDLVRSFATLGQEQEVIDEKTKAAEGEANVVKRLTFIPNTSLTSEMQDPAACSNSNLLGTLSNQYNGEVTITQPEEPNYYVGRSGYGYYKQPIQSHPNQPTDRYVYFGPRQSNNHRDNFY